MKNFDRFWRWLNKQQRSIRTLGDRSSFSIFAEGDSGLIQSSKTKRHSFSRGSAMRVWDRYHGARLSAGFNDDIHLRASTYAVPNKGARDSSAWAECPNKTCCPWIAAAIAFFLGEHPHQ